MRQAAKAIARAVPGVIPFVRHARFVLERWRLQKADPERVFTDIFRKNAWGGSASISGRGSDYDQAKTLMAELPRIFRDASVSSVIDVPCGDFNWMRHVNLSGISYLGGDIVADLIAANKRTYEKGNISFAHMNLLSDKLPRADLVLCRDCLVHFSYRDVFKALGNISASGATYALLTTFPGRKNRDIATGQWRPLDMQGAPFNLPAPTVLLNERRGGEYPDKSLGLWRVSELKH